MSLKQKVVIIGDEVEIILWEDLKQRLKDVKRDYGDAYVLVDMNLNINKTNDT